MAILEADEVIAQYNEMDKPSTQNSFKEGLEKPENKELREKLFESVKYIAQLNWLMSNRNSGRELGLERDNAKGFRENLIPQDAVEKIAELDNPTDSEVKDIIVTSYERAKQKYQLLTVLGNTSHDSDELLELSSEELSRITDESPNFSSWIESLRSKWLGANDTYFEVLDEAADMLGLSIEDVGNLNDSQINEIRNAIAKYQLISEFSDREVLIDIFEENNELLETAFIAYKNWRRENIGVDNQTTSVDLDKINELLEKPNPLLKGRLSKLERAIDEGNPFDFYDIKAEIDKNYTIDPLNGYAFMLLALQKAEEKGNDGLAAAIQYELSADFNPSPLQALLMVDDEIKKEKK